MRKVNREMHFTLWEGELVSIWRSVFIFKKDISQKCTRHKESLENNNKYPQTLLLLKEVFWFFSVFISCYLLMDTLNGQLVIYILTLGWGNNPKRCSSLQSSKEYGKRAESLLFLSINLSNQEFALVKKVVVALFALFFFFFFALFALILFLLLYNAMWE